MQGGQGSQRLGCDLGGASLLFWNRGIESPFTQKPVMQYPGSQSPQGRQEESPSSVQDLANHSELEHWVQIAHVVRGAGAAVALRYLHVDIPIKMWISTWISEGISMCNI